jgi:2-iminobutanoate/2-iminopropanoate deaminase
MRIEGRSDQVPAPAGPYSQAVRIGSLVSVAGQAGARPDGSVEAGVAAQTRQTMANVGHALSTCGATWADVLHMRVYLTDPEHFAEMNEVYRSFFAEPYPARTTVYVGLPAGLLVEIDALAALE